jgi:hypothetical protein
MSEKPEPSIPSRPYDDSLPEVGPASAAPFPENGQTSIEAERKRLQEFYSNYPAVMWTGMASMLLLMVAFGVMLWHNFVTRMPFVTVQSSLVACGVAGALFAALSRKMCPIEMEQHRRRVRRDMNTHLLLAGLNLALLLWGLWKRGALG